LTEFKLSRRSLKWLNIALYSGYSVCVCVVVNALPEFTELKLSLRGLKWLNIPLYLASFGCVAIVVNASPEFTESKLSRRLFRGFSVIFSAPAKLAALRQSLA